METTEIFGVDIHDAVMGLKQAIDDQKLIIRSPMTIRALARVRLGSDGRVDPSTVGSGSRNGARIHCSAAGAGTRSADGQDEREPHK
jgi:hypothetical protein